MEVHLHGLPQATPQMLCHHTKRHANLHTQELVFACKKAVSQRHNSLGLYRLLSPTFLSLYSGNFTASNRTPPPVILQLQNATGIPICNLTLTSTGGLDSTGNLHQLIALYQNAQSCVAVLSEAASLNFVMNATAGAAVCFSDLTMLPVKS